jgi:hypothetical protein
MAGIHDEDEFDELASQMVLDDVASQVSCPSLMVSGEYDPLSHLEDVVAIYEKVPAPKELWIVENDFHSPKGTSNFGGIDYYPFLIDWLRAALDAKKPANLDRTVLVRQGGALGPYGPEIELDEIRLPGRRQVDGLSGRDPLYTDLQLGPAGIVGGQGVAR